MTIARVVSGELFLAEAKEQGEHRDSTEKLRDVHHTRNQMQDEEAQQEDNEAEHEQDHNQHDHHE